MTTKFQVTTAKGGVLGSYFSSLASAYAYADECNAAGWSGLLIVCQWTGRVVSRA